MGNGEQSQLWNDTDYWEPQLIKYGIPPIPHPSGMECPEDVWTMLNATILNNKTANFLCVAEFPNLPLYGNLSVRNWQGEYIAGTPRVRTNTVFDWDKLLSPLLHTFNEHWRYPLVLTDILIQPWTTSRFVYIKHKRWCYIPTHICVIGILWKQPTYLCGTEDQFKNATSGWYNSSYTITIGYPENYNPTMHKTGEPVYIHTEPWIIVNTTGDHIPIIYNNTIFSLGGVNLTYTYRKEQRYWDQMEWTKYVSQSWALHIPYVIIPKGEYIYHVRNFTLRTDHTNWNNTQAKQGTRRSTDKIKSIFFVNSTIIPYPKRGQVLNYTKYGPNVTICHIHSQGNIAPIPLNLEGKCTNQTMFVEPWIKQSEMTKGSLNPNLTYTGYQNKNVWWNGWRQVNLTNPIIDYYIPTIVRLAPTQIFGQ